MVWLPIDLSINELTLDLCTRRTFFPYIRAYKCSQGHTLFCSVAVRAVKNFRSLPPTAEAFDGGRGENLGLACDAIKGEVLFLLVRFLWANKKNEYHYNDTPFVSIPKWGCISTSIVHESKIFI